MISAMKQVLAVAILFLLSPPLAAAPPPPHPDYQEVKRVIEYAIGWAVEKDFDKMFAIWAQDDTLYHHWLSSESTLRGFTEFEKHSEAWRDPEFKGTTYDFKDLVISFSRSGDVAWYSCRLDDCYEYKGKPGCVRNVLQTGTLEKRDGKWVHVLMHGSYPVDQIPDEYLETYYRDKLAPGTSSREGLGREPSQAITNGEGTQSLSGPYLGQEPPGLEPALFAPGVVSTGSNELSISFSPDADEAFFFVTGPSYQPRFILHTRLVGDSWTTPREPSFRDPERTDSYPFVAPDGRSVFFCSSRALAQGGGHHHEIFVVERAGEGWAEPEKVDFGDGEGGFGTFPSVAANGNLYFNWGHGAEGSDIFVSKLDDDGSYSKPQNLGPAVNSDAGDFHPYIAPDESYLLFDSVREDDNAGRNDLFISFRQPDGTWTKAQNLGPQVNTTFGEMRPFVTADGAYLFFASSRPRARELPTTLLSRERIDDLVNEPGNGLQDIYWVSAKVIPKR